MQFKLIANALPNKFHLMTRVSKKRRKKLKINTY